MRCCSRRNGRSRHDHPSVRRADQAQRGRAASDRARAVHRRRAASRHTARRFRAEPARARAHCVDRRFRRAPAAPASSPSTLPRASAISGSRDRWWCRRRRSRVASSTSAPKGRSPAARCAMSASRSRWWSRRAATSPRTPQARFVVEWDPLPVAASLEQAATAGAPRVHDDLPDNVAARVRQTKGDYAAAAKGAHLVLKRRFTYDHGCAMPIETRGVVAQWDAGTDRLTVWDTTQAPIAVRNGLALACSDSRSARFAWSRPSSAAGSGRRSCCSIRTRCWCRGRR